jgi:protein TonB
VRAQLRGGAILSRDYPRAAQGSQGTVEARLTISATGAVIGCAIARSSGNAVLDETTCRLIRQRFRFNPARDEQGNALPDEKGWRQRWWRD